MWGERQNEMPWADAGPVVCAAHIEFVRVCVCVSAYLTLCLSSTTKSHLPVSPSGHAAFRLVLAWEPVIRNSYLRVHVCVSV